MVWLDSDGPSVHLQLLLHPLGRGWWYPAMMLSGLQNLPTPDRIALEQVQTRPGQGAQMWTAIRWGYLHAALVATWPRAAIWTPTAAAWMKVMHKDQPGAGKERSVALCSSELPGLDLTPGRRRKPHSGLADAGGLALWAMRRR